MKDIFVPFDSGNCIIDENMYITTCYNFFLFQHEMEWFQIDATIQIGFSPSSTFGDTFTVFFKYILALVDDEKIGKCIQKIV